MQHLSFVLFQLDEARRYIQDGRSQHLRLAFLLLDNAAEIQMDRRIKEEMDREDWRERMRNSLLQDVAQRPHEQLPQALQEIIDWHPLTRSERVKIDRFYDEKITCLVNRGGHLDATLAAPLRPLHKYRNEAYHRASIRPGTIRTATLILFEINCQMLLTLYPGPSMMDGEEDYSWIKERFAYNLFLHKEQQLLSIIDELRSELLPSDEAVAKVLADHLQDRFSQLSDSLNFIVENSGRANTKEEALRLCQRHAESSKTPPANDSGQKHSLQSISHMAALISQVRGAAGRVGAFARFVAIEKDLEPIEECVNQVVDKIDEAIQVAVDIARGK